MTSLHTRLLLIRHAHVDTHARLCGTLDLPLSAKGRTELDRLLQHPPAAPPDALYTSPLARAHEVAVRLSRAWNVAAHEAASLREICCGSFEGVPIAEIQARHPELWARNEAQDDDDFTWPGGESYRAFRARVMRGLGAIADRHPAGRVAVVTHAGVIAQILGCLKQRPAAVWELDRPAPLSATEIDWMNGGPARVVSFNVRNWW